MGSNLVSVGPDEAARGRRPYDAGKADISLWDFGVGVGACICGPQPLILIRFDLCFCLRGFLPVKLPIVAFLSSTMIRQLFVSLLF